MHRANVFDNGYISIHAPREGSDSVRVSRGFSAAYFYPLSPRGERQLDRIARSLSEDISIHAPREGSDPCRWRPCPCCAQISIHPPREGSDPDTLITADSAEPFLSTLP